MRRKLFRKNRHARLIAKEIVVSAVAYLGRDLAEGRLPPRVVVSALQISLVNLESWNRRNMSGECQQPEEHLTRPLFGSSQPMLFLFRANLEKLSFFSSLSHGLQAMEHMRRAAALMNTGDRETSQEPRMDTEASGFYG